MSNKVYYFVVVPFLMIISYFVVNYLPENLKPYLAVVIGIIITYSVWRDLKKAKEQEEIRRISVLLSFTIIFLVIGILSLIL
ncbi:hypothetical protein BKP35_13255 [Anaerobacillus arseniciselenatis]|uniref:Uncharacterized protein n=1 Tax=Anaerobacillus arseniciselenatis TaxID=85682 RepID=A0A1S2LE34_9BACI|nr:hypothetical protein [Anaerobacillus arseniciselenatis]OIJ10651.1 hypothetical protein BKP35_13255 [Anaerobacillus arseniciselenatis]